METLNAAVIGAGSMGFNHARVYSEMPQTELVAVCDKSGDRSKLVGSEFDCKSYKNHKKMLSTEDIHILSIAVPTKYHAPVSLDCINAGIDLLVEKPIADTSKNGKKIIRKADKNDVNLMIGHIERFNPAVRMLKERLEKGDLGKVFKLQSRREGPFPRRIRDVGVVIDLAVHDLDLMRYFTESEVKRVYAEAERRIHTKHEDMLNSLLKFKNGAVGALSVNWLTPEKIREISVLGEKGMFVVKYLSQELWFYENVEVNDEDYTYSNILMGVSEGDIRGSRVKKQEPLRNELEYFVDCVSNGRNGHSNGVDGLKALELAEAIIGSTKKNRAVKVR